jgi:hypothetical protein
MRVVQWNACIALLCFMSIAGCGKGPDESKRDFDKPGLAKDKSTADKPGLAKDKSTADKPQAPKEQVAPVHVTGETLTADYKRNKEEADKKYRGKVLEVEAVVENMHPFGYLMLKATPGMELQCTAFGAEFLKKHPDITPGKTITLHAKVGVVTYKGVNLDEPALIAPKPTK